MGIQTGDQKGFAASSRGFNPLVRRFGPLNVLDDVIRHRASDRIQYPILAYPKYENDPASYSYYTGKQLDAMIDQAAAKLVSDGFQQVRISLFLVYYGSNGERIDCKKSGNSGIVDLFRLEHGHYLFRNEPARLYCHDTIPASFRRSLCITFRSC